MSLLLRARPAATPPPETTRNRRGISNIFLTNMDKGERLTLAEAIRLLQSKW